MALLTSEFNSRVHLPIEHKMLHASVFVICTVVALSAARTSPNADVVDQLLRENPSLRISDDIITDAKLDVPDLVRKYRYPLEVHNVVTPDGYILEMHRIPHGRDRNNVHDPNKPVIFLMHGLLSSSADWLVMGPGSAFGYILAEEGFDVWMGNARGNYYSRRHQSLKPDALLNTKFWRFSWEEIGNIDLPTMIDYALDKTGKRQLHYVGHSQGTTSFFVMGSLRPQFAYNKIKSMHAFAPVAFMAHNQNFLLRIIASYANDIEKLTRLIGLGEFMPNNELMTWLGKAFCSDDVPLQIVCSNLLFMIGGWNEEQHNATMLPVKLGHSPAGAAARQFVHYGQSITHKGFRRYDHGRIKNLLTYGKTSPPDFDLSSIRTPVFMHYSENDPLAEVEDVYRLFRELGNPVGLFKIPLRSFTHLDFVWGIDANTLLYYRTINYIRAIEEN